MGKKKKLFPFRFRWFSAPSAPQTRPITPPKDESKSQEQADTAILIRGSPARTPAGGPTMDIPIADPQQDTLSHPLQPEKLFSVTNGSSGPSQSKSESLAFMSSFSTPQPQLPAEQEKEQVAVTQQEQQSVVPPLETIPKSHEPTQRESSAHVSEPIPQVKESPSRTISTSKDQSQPEASSHVSDKSASQTKTEAHVFESMPQSKESPSKTIPNSQEIARSETSPHLSESLPHMESAFRSTPKTQDLTQQEASSHVSEPVSQPKTESHAFESKPISKQSPSKTLPKSQEITQSETPSQLHESVPQLKESPSETSPKSKEQTRLKISSHESAQKTQVKESPLKTSPHVSKPMPQENMSSLKIFSMPEGPIQPKASPQPKTMSPEHHKSRTSTTQIIDQSSMVIREKRNKQDTQESIESKVMFASNSTGKDTKVVSSIYPVTKNVPSTSHVEDGSPIGGKTPLKEGIKEDVSKFVKKLAMGQPGDAMGDKSTRAITLAGKNRGVTMLMGSQSTKKEGSIHIHRDYRTDSHESPGVTTEADGEEGSSNNSVEPEEVGNAYVNSNIQSINNSLMYQGSVTEKDPGVQLILPPRPAKSIKSDDEDSKG